jgi:putative ABC transport system permease protein
MLAIRNALKYKAFTLITIAGLSLGIASALFTLIEVNLLLNFDRFHTNKDRIFEVQQMVYLQSGEYRSDRVGGAYAQALLDGFPEIEKTTRLGAIGEQLVTVTLANDESLHFIEENIWAADSDFFNIFSFETIKGAPDGMLKDKNSIVLTRNIAEKYFGADWELNDSILGSSININSRVDLLVTGIIENTPADSHIQFEMLVPMPLMPEFGRNIDSFGGTMYNTFLLLKENSTSYHINEAITAFILAQHEADIRTEQFLVPLKDIHLHNEGGNIIAVYIFGAIGILILTIACINYINLATARALNRAKEVGVSKVQGATRSQLIFQYLGEAFLYTLISTQLAIIFIELLLPVFNMMTETPIEINYSDPGLIFSVIGLVLITSLLAGGYPAFVLSSMTPSGILGKMRMITSGGSMLRKILVVVQFSFTAFFIVSAIVLIRQFDHLASSDPGYDNKDVIYIPLRSTQNEDYESLKSELLSHHGIKNVTTGSGLPGYVEYGEINWGREEEDNNMIARVLISGYDLAKTFSLEMTAGHYYARNTPSDTIDGIVVNEKVVEYMGLEDPVGAPFYFWGRTYRIIGVVEQYNFFPLSVGNEAMIIPFDPVSNFLFIKMTPNSENSVIDYTKTLMAKYNPKIPFEYYHLDEFKFPMLENSDSLNRILIYTSLFGLFISCLGLYGLAIFTAEQRIKEIGIRKVFGARVSTIVYSLSVSFLKLVALANLIAIPIAYFSLRATLNFFTTRIDVGIWVFVLTAVITLFIAFITVSWKSLKAALSNPVASLRYE